MHETHETEPRDLPARPDVPADGRGRWWQRWLWVAAALVGVALVVPPLLGVGIGQVLLFLLVLACPLMHFLGGHGHGHGGHTGSAGRDTPPPRS